MSHWIERPDRTDYRAAIIIDGLPWGVTRHASSVGDRPTTAPVVIGPLSCQWDCHSDRSQALDRIPVDALELAGVPPAQKLCAGDAHILLGDPIEQVVVLVCAHSDHAVGGTHLCCRHSPLLWLTLFVMRCHPLCTPLY